jgi:hypothetical protein
VTELLARGRHGQRPPQRVVTVPRSAYAVTWMDQRALPE